MQADPAFGLPEETENSICQSSISPHIKEQCLGTPHAVQLLPNQTLASSIPPSLHGIYATLADMYSVKLK